jgi:cell division protein FtsL
VTPPAAAAPAVGARRSDGRARLPAGPRPARRISGPARRQPPAAAPRRLERGGLALELLSALERLASHRLLDRLIRGRAWLALVMFALIGIVTLQLMLLKLNGAVGRALESQASLQRENATLSIENSELAATERIQSRAAQAGMEFASSSALRFLTANPAGDLKRSASVLSAPLHPSSAGGEEAAPGAAGASSSAEGSEHGGSEAHGSEAPASGAAASSEAPASSAASATPEGGSTQSSPAPSEAAEAPSQAPQAPAASSPSSASPAGGTQAAPGG